MVTLWQKLVRPEFFFRPAQLLRYVTRRYLRSPATFETVRLPWGLQLRLRPEEMVGNVVWRWGVHELFVCEAIWRLLDPAEHAVDIGANIGQMTSLMARRSGSGGKVSAFEAHPLVYDELLANTGMWQSLPDLAAIDTYKVAVSNRSGTGRLAVPAGFASLSSLTMATAALSLRDVPCTKETVWHDVPETRLDDVFADDVAIAVLKLDVEGHEAAVLEGAARLLDRGRIRDIILEEHGAYPTPATKFLEAHGYSLFSLGRNFWGPHCRVAAETQPPMQWCEVPNFLATLAPARALARLQGKGWSVLGCPR